MPMLKSVVSVVSIVCVSAVVALSLAGRCAIAAPPAAVQSEPTNAEEAAAKKKAAEAAVAAKYEALVATLPAEEQAWEKVLQQQLGSFYLPHHQADKVAGRSNAWDFVKDDPALPRVLLIGDSVSRGYTAAVRKALAGKANVHRAPANCGPTASGIKHIDAWLTDHPGGEKWDVIHFNFGIHDRGTPLADYTARLEQLVQRRVDGEGVLGPPTREHRHDRSDCRGDAHEQRDVVKSLRARAVHKAPQQHEARSQGHEHERRVHKAGVPVDEGGGGVQETSSNGGDARSSCVLCTSCSPCTAHATCAAACLACLVCQWDVDAARMHTARRAPRRRCAPAAA